MSVVARRPNVFESNGTATIRFHGAAFESTFLDGTFHAGPESIRLENFDTQSPGAANPFRLDIRTGRDIRFRYTRYF